MSRMKKMTKDEYLYILIKVLTMLKMEHPNRIIEDILFALFKIPKIDEWTANELFETVKGYLSAVESIEPFHTSKLMSKAMLYSMKLAEYHLSQNDKSYEKAVNLLEKGKDESSLYWSSCEKGIHMLNERVVPSNYFDGKMTVQYELKNENIDFDYEIEEER